MDKKNLLLAIFTFALLAADFAAAANVALIVGLPGGSVIERCINVGPNTDGYRIFQKSGIKSEWSYSVGLGHFLSSVEGYGSSSSEGYWAFFIYDRNSQQWKLSPVGSDGGSCWNGDYSSYSGHYCGSNGDMIGWVRTTWNSDYTPQNQPPLDDFTNICGLSITNVNAIVDGKKQGNLQEGDKISNVYPGSTVQIEVEVSNLFQGSKDIKINNAYARITAQGIDEDEDVEVESDEFSIRQGASRKVKLSFNVPITALEDSYTLFIEAEGEGSDGFTYKDSKVLYLSVKKDSHRLKILDFNLSGNLSCGQKTLFAHLNIANIGRNDEDASVLINASGLGLVGRISRISVPAESGSSSLYSIDIPLNLENASSGVHEVSAALYYYGNKEESAAAQLNVLDCPSPSSPAEDKTISEMIPSNSQNSGVPSPELNSQPAYAMKANDNQDIVLILMVVAATLLIVLAGAVLLLIIKKK